MESEVDHQGEDFGVGEVPGAAEFGEAVEDARAECLEQRRVASLGVHRRLELALVGEQGGELAFDRRGHVLGVVREVGFEQQQRRWTERIEPEVAVEVGVE